MILSNTATELKVCLFGALNGLLVGLSLELVRLSYLKHQAHQLLIAAANRGESIGYILEPAANGLIPVLCIVAFGAAAHLIHRYFVNNPAWLLRFWLALGVVGIASWYFETTIHSLLAFIMILLFVTAGLVFYERFRSNPDGQLSFWLATGYTAVGMVFVVVQTIGLLMVQRYELREPFLWILCLAIVFVINLSFGAAAKNFAQPRKM